MAEELEELRLSVAVVLCVLGFQWQWEMVILEPAARGEAAPPPLECRFPGQGQEGRSCDCPLWSVLCVILGGWITELCKC